VALWTRIAALIVLLGIVLSPLRALAATIPMFIAYDAAVRSTATVGIEDGPSLRPDTARVLITVYGDARFRRDVPRRLRLADGSGAVCAYDDALQHADRRETGAV
jgi:hypothetical protein